MSQGRDETFNIDKILSNLTSQQQAILEKRKLIEELNFKNIDNNYELITEVTKSDVKKDFKLSDPLFLFQLGQLPMFDKDKLAKVKPRSPFVIPNNYKQYKY